MTTNLSDNEKIVVKFLKMLEKQRLEEKKDERRENGCRNDAVRKHFHELSPQLRYL